MQFRVGVMVLATLIITGILVILFEGQRTLFQPKVAYTIRFPEAPGVSANTPVLMSGIVVGRVRDVRLDDNGDVLVTAEIDADKAPRQGDVCRIITTLLGDAKLQFVRAKEAKAVAPLPPSEEVRGLVPMDPLLAVQKAQEDLGSGMQSLSQTGQSVLKTSDQIREMLKRNEEPINRVVDQADQTMAMLRKSVENLNEVLGDPEIKDKVRMTIEQMPQVLQETRETLARMGKTMSLVDANLDNVQEFTRSLKDRGPAMLARLDQGAGKIDQLVEELLQFTKDLNNQRGSLGQLIHNPELYDNLNRAAVNIEELSRQLRPILQDARVFTDKIARHPESLGVRGALERRPGIK